MSTADDKAREAGPELLEALLILWNMKEGLYHGIAWPSKEEEEKIEAVIKKVTA